MHRESSLGRSIHSYISQLLIHIQATNFHGEWRVSLSIEARVLFVLFFIYEIKHS